MIKKQVSYQEVIDFLNRLLELDKENMKELFFKLRKVDRSLEVVDELKLFIENNEDYLSVFDLINALFGYDERTNCGIMSVRLSKNGDIKIVETSFEDVIANAQKRAMLLDDIYKDLDKVKKELKDIWRKYAKDSHIKDSNEFELDFDYFLKEFLDRLICACDEPDNDDESDD